MRACVLFTLAMITAWPMPVGASVVTIGGSKAVACYEAADRRLLTGDSFAACDAALTSEPLDSADRVGTFVNRGILQMHAGRLDQAAADFGEAARIDPRQPEVYVNQAALAYRRAQYAASRDLASRALELGTSKPAIAYFLRGIAHENLGSLKAAYADLNLAASLAPAWAEPRRELARYKVR